MRKEMTILAMAFLIISTVSVTSARAGENDQTQNKAKVIKGANLLIDGTAGFLAGRAIKDSWKFGKVIPEARLLTPFYVAATTLFTLDALHQLGASVPSPLAVVENNMKQAHEAAQSFLQSSDKSAVGSPGSVLAAPNQ